MISNDIIGAEDTEIKENLEVAGTAVLKNDVKIDEGLIIGNPTGGNKGAGTINAEKIYVDGSEIGGGGECISLFSKCERHCSFGKCGEDGNCSGGWAGTGCGGYSYKWPADATCPPGYKKVYVSSTKWCVMGHNDYALVALKITTCCK